jgi:transcriptional regulator with XRE-family HTH domain
MTAPELPLAHWIRERRTELGLTQAALGEQCGVPQPIVSRWEQGVRVPHDEHMSRLTGVLGLPPASIPPAPRRRIIRRTAEA